MPRMLAYAVAGLVVGWLSWQFGRVGQDPDQPSFFTQALFGAIGAVVGGVGLNLVAGHGLLAVEPVSFTVGVVLALVVLGMLQVGARRRAD